MFDFRLESIKDLVLGKPLMLVLLKLFSYAVNVKVNRQELIKPELNAVNVMLGALNLALWAEQESGTTATKGQTISEQILQIMETILLEASSQSTEEYTVCYFVSSNYCPFCLTDVQTLIKDMQDW